MIRKITLMVHQDDVWTVVAGLLREDSVQFIQPEQQVGQGDEQQCPESQQEHLERLGEQLDVVMDSLGIEPPEETTGNLPQKIENFKSIENEIARMQEETAGIADRMDTITSEKSRLKEQKQNLAAIVPSSIPPNLWQETRLTAIIFGWIPADQENQITLSFQSVPLILIPLQKQGNRSFIAAASLKKHAFILRRFLSSVYFDELKISLDSGDSLESSGQDVQQTIHRLDQQTDQILGEREQTAAKYRNRIHHLYQVIRENSRICHIIRQYGLPGEYYNFKIRGRPNQIQQVSDVVGDLTDHPYNVLSVETESKVA